MTTPIPFSISDIESALSVKALINNCSKNYVFSGISTDSRNLQKSNLFIALKGENFDGSDFVAPLFSDGIKGFIVKKGFFEQLSENLKKTFNSKKNGIALFETKNTLAALGALAKYQRVRSKAKIIAITGSSGKTTTRKITGEILKNSFTTLTTKGNFNNEIGLPLTLLQLSSDHKWAVIEMGMNHAGEISRLSAIAVPDIGIITNISAVHLEGLGTVNNIAHAKAEMFQHMNNNSIAVLNIDDPRLKILKSKANENPKIKEIICFGEHEDADIKAFNISHSKAQTNLSISYKDQQNIDVSINSPAPFMIFNILAAVAACLKAGANKKDIIKGIKAFAPEQGRMNLLTISAKLNLIDDTYNANPNSVKNAIMTLSLVSSDGNKSIAVLGDMLELGTDSQLLHEETGKFAAQKNISKIYTYGKLASFIIKGAVKAGFPVENTMSGTQEEIARKIVQEINSTSSSLLTWVLVKGSRGMKMEKVIYIMKKLMSNNKKMEKRA